MLDIKFVRENPKVLDAAMANRPGSSDAERFFALDEERRSVISQVEDLQATRNAESKKIGIFMKEGKREEAEAAKEAVRQVNEQIEGLAARRSRLRRRGRRLHGAHPQTSLPRPRPWVRTRTRTPSAVAWASPATLPPRALSTQGPLGPGYRDPASWTSTAAPSSPAPASPCSPAQTTALDRALQNFFLNTHISRGLKEFIPPVIVNRGVVIGTGQLPKFEDDAVTRQGQDAGPPHRRGRPHQLACRRGARPPASCPCATPRAPRASARRNWRARLVAIPAASFASTKFTKVEMVKFTIPEESDAELESMVAEAEFILQQLGLPYRVISLCTGDLGFSARQTYDIEVWLPSYNAYEEISSCSTAVTSTPAAPTSSTATPRTSRDTRFVHTLNGSGLPTGRTMAAIMENYRIRRGTVHHGAGGAASLHGRRWRRSSRWYSGSSISICD